MEIWSGKGVYVLDTHVYIIGNGMEGVGANVCPKPTPPGTLNSSQLWENMGGGGLENLWFTHTCGLWHDIW